MIKSLHHVRFHVQNLDEVEVFASDFGLLTAERTENRLVMRTYGGDSCVYIAEKADKDAFIGFAVEVEQSQQLDEAVAKLGATAVADLDIPGGGQFVALIDPDGNEVRLIHGCKRLDPAPYEPELMINTPGSKVRLGRAQSSRPVGPARIWRIGHVVMAVKSFAASSAWYAEKLGIIASDVLHLPGQPQAQIVGFFRLDRGDEFVDHHTIAFFQDARGGCHHVSFEVQDYEAQFRTHRFLQKQEYEAIWGVGRHPQGSHVFDVWRGPDGTRFETYSDTDLLQAKDGSHYHDVSTVDMDVWSNDPPDRYFA